MTRGTGHTWVFGYGSLVSPTSVARTTERVIDAPHERVVTHLRGYGRRWNYGSHRLRGNWTADGVSVTNGTVISLGLAVAADEACNGVSILVTPDELDRLDERERDYEMTDITDSVTIESDHVDPAALGRVVTFVPRATAIARYETARDAGRAAVEVRYWNLVHAAFDELGVEHRRLLDSTPSPDVPVVDVELLWPPGTGRRSR